MVNYLVVLDEVERSTVLNALAKSTIYGSHAKEFAILMEKIASAPALEKEREAGSEREDA
jgi:hypothetical protein